MTLEVQNRLVEVKTAKIKIEKKKLA